jgi:cyclopropane fatty-acyl-phospholipid synthase-like methyltransferase
VDNQLETINIYNNYVDEYVKKFMHFDLYNDTFDFLLELLPKECNVLELGCGPGNVINYFTTKRADLTILGVDLAPEMLNQAKKINPESDFQLLDIRNADQIKQQYSSVVGAFCLPYLSFEDLDKFFLDLKNLTKEDGLIYLSCMEGERDKSGFEKTSFTGDSEIYIYYHQRNNIEKKLFENGFSIEKFYTKDYLETDGSVTTDLIYIGRKK